MSLQDNRASWEQDIIRLEEEIAQLQLGEIPELDALEDRVEVLEGQTVSISGDLAQEILDRAAADTALGLEIDAVEQYVDDAIAAIPPVDFTGYATEQYVDDAIAAIPPVDFTGYATEQYVDDAIAAIPPVNLTGYATEQYVDDAIAAIPPVDFTGYATEQYVDDAIAAIPPVDLTQIESDIDDLETLTASIQTDLDTAESAIAQEILDRQEQDAQTLADAQGYADSLHTAQGLEIDAVENRIGVLETFGYDQVLYVAKNGLDTNSGKQHAPFLTITAALNAITDASPTKRYAILVQAGAYTEAALSLKANVYIVGEGQKENVSITGAVSLHSSFSGSADNRSGFARVVLSSACDFNWQTVTSAAGKLYFNEVSFSSTINMYGHNNATAQAQFNDCIIFGNLTISGINVGVFTNNVCFGNITLNQHPNGGMASVLNAAGGYCAGTVSMITTVNNFGRRSALFARSFWMNAVVINGASSYADVTDSSLPAAGPTISNGGNIVYLNAGQANKTLSNLSFPTAVNSPIMPATTGATNFGDWNKQWAWSFSYVHASSGSDAYLISYGPSFNPDSLGRNVGIYADGGQLQANVNGGNIDLGTAAVSGTGIRGKITLDGRVIDVTSKKIVNVASGTDATDAINKGQFDSAIAAIPSTVYYRYTLQAADIIAKQIILPSTPIEPLNVTMDVHGGIEQKSGLDFTITGNVLSWIGNSYELLAEANDNLMIEYKA